jgi:nuclear transport factor 2 (NTF2) superfamily protein
VISAYLANIETVIDQYTQASFVQHITYSVERRPGDQAYLHGTFFFVDGSSLHFREFLDLIENQVEKRKYAYHYQDNTGQMIFRYDNANHRPPLGFVEHRHDREGIVPAWSPDLGAVLDEITHGVGGHEPTSR